MKLKPRSEALINFSSLISLLNRERSLLQHAFSVQPHESHVMSFCSVHWIRILHLVVNKWVHSTRRTQQIIKWCVYGITSDDWKFSTRCGWVHDDVQWALLSLARSPPCARSAQVIEPRRVRAARINTNLLYVYAPTSGHSLGGVRAFCPPQQYYIHFISICTLVCECV